MFPYLSEKKRKLAFLRFRKLINNPNFTNSMIHGKRTAWNEFNEVVRK